MTEENSTARFTARAENYLKYRPRYPRAVVPLLQNEIGLSRDWQVADIGSGTGFLAELFVDLGCEVVGVEPNQAMRQAGDFYLAGRGNFRSLNASAEATCLPDSSFDLVTAGQAFHWFKPGLARQEFIRILRRPGWITLAWNSRPVTMSPVNSEYESILELLDKEYRNVAEKNTRPAALESLLENEVSLAHARFPSPQRYSWDQLRGRALSSSYAPLPSDPRHAGFVNALRTLFERYQRDGKLDFLYETNLYWGQIN